MQIYIKRSKNRTASGVFLHSLILRAPTSPHAHENAKKMRHSAKNCSKAHENAKKVRFWSKKLVKAHEMAEKMRFGREKHEKAQEIRERMCTILD